MYVKSRTCHRVLPSLALGILLGVGWGAIGTAQATPGPTGDKKPDDVAHGGKMVTTPSGLKYEDLKVGTSPIVAAKGKRVKVHYTGTLANGTKFDSSRDRNEPFEFTLGAGEVIRGWDEGVDGMKVGGKRKLIIPPNLGYGARGVGGVIPPNAELHFEVELLAVTD